MPYGAERVVREALNHVRGKLSERRGVDSEKLVAEALLRFEGIRRVEFVKKKKRQKEKRDLYVIFEKGWKNNVGERMGRRSVQVKSSGGEVLMAIFLLGGNPNRIVVVNGQMDESDLVKQIVVGARNVWHIELKLKK